jgi:hypothetical protein
VETRAPVRGAWNSTVVALVIGAAIAFSCWARIWTNKGDATHVYFRGRARAAIGT